MRRTSTGKRVDLTDRDIALFKLLHRYRYLRSNFLYAFLGGNSETRFKERLGHLYHDGRYINRPEQQWQFANCRYMPVVYELDDAGERVRRDNGLIRNQSPLLSKGRTGAYRQFAHQLMICECLASIELGVAQQSGLRFISWQEIIARGPQTTGIAGNPFEFSASISRACRLTGRVLSADIKLVPDGLFGLEYENGEDKSYRFFALEVDRNTMPIRRSGLDQTSYLRKILGYQQIIERRSYKSCLGIPNLFVLTVTTNEIHMANIMALVQGLNSGRGSKLFLFQSTNRSASPADLLNVPWRRAGHAEFFLNRVGQVL
ncbi:MAG: replication-relaxation family protein [Pseudolabrys sp.]|nr:replication-relaxation family protein [Pseudolabrys sp.]MDP2296135.1 replication-relaxation family protein [Pseudolabrys sp.]